MIGRDRGGRGRGERGGAGLRVTSLWRGRGQAAQRVTPRPPRPPRIWGLMGKVLAGAGGSYGACGTAAVARRAASTGQSGSGEAGRQAAEGSSGPGLRRATRLGRKARRGVEWGESQGSADRAAAASCRSGPGGSRSSVALLAPRPASPAPPAFGRPSIFEPEPRASPQPPDSVPPFGPRVSVSSHFCVLRARSQALGPLPLPSLASDLFFHIFSGVPKFIALSTQGLLGDLLCPPRYPCLLSSSSHPCPVSSLSFPIPVLFFPRCLAPLSITRPHHLPRDVTGLFQPVPAIPVYLSPSYPGSPQKPCFCPTL